jgi:NAD+ diphosphatase
VTRFAFEPAPLDRGANIRAKPEEVAKYRASPHVGFVRLAGDQVAFAGGQLTTTAPDAATPCIFLGTDATGKPWFAAEASASDSLVPLRTLMVDGLLPPDALSIVAQGRSLVHWHESHRFCARCGAESLMQDAGYRRHCPQCSADHFPRTDPVVIMAVIKDNRTLLGRQKSWPANMYSTLAGFMEPGETIETAVRREVFEEVGLRLARIDYVASQPWPFPASLMIGMIGVAEDETLTIDHNEIETARWFDAGEVQMMLDRTHPEGLTASRPDAIAWHLTKEALQRIRG